MEIIIGKTAGFCFGVQRAVTGSIKENSDIKKVYCLGELVHNKEVINNLIDKGIEIIDNFEMIKDNNSKVIIRAHGIPKNIYNEISKRKIELIDYTCPFVLKTHEIADKYQKDGYYIFVVGDKNHPEIIGTISYCGNNSFIIEDECDINEALKRLNESNIKKLLIIVQTTFSEEKFKKIVKIIQEKLLDINITIKNTICDATSKRQNETESIAKNVDVMIIIGGKNSSNTKKLFDIAKNNCDKAFLIETKDDLDTRKLNKSQKIGIMAGASTPNESIMGVVEKIKMEVVR